METIGGKATTEYGVSFNAEDQDLRTVSEEHHCKKCSGLMTNTNTTN